VYIRTGIVPINLVYIRTGIVPINLVYIRTGIVLINFRSLLCDHRRFTELMNHVGLS